MTYGHIEGMDKPISRLILGTMLLSAAAICRYTCAMLDRFVSLGGNAIDTARTYGDGSERAVGNWLQLRGNRAEIVIVGKGRASRRSSARASAAMRSPPTWSRAWSHLQTDYIDLYLLHRDDPSVPVGEIVECAERAPPRRAHPCLWGVELDGGAPAGGQRLRAEPWTGPIRGE